MAHRGIPGSARQSGLAETELLSPQATTAAFDGSRMSEALVGGAALDAPLGCAAGKKQEKVRDSMTMRSVAYVGTLALFAQVLLTQACGGDNAPATTEGTGGSPGAGGTTDVTSNGGATTPDTGAGGTTTPDTSGSGGAAGADQYQPLCNSLLTAANVAPTKNGICVDGDPQLCYKTCGPESSGFKSETCTAGVYVEQSGCSFPPGDYSCYKIPTTIDPSCPAEVPQATTECSVAACTLCNFNGGYLDSSGAAKTGYCVCQAPSATTGLQKWSCASTTAWPCPAGEGC